jgi:ribosome-binding protein aMBF1 (putative translation factor)
MEHQDFKTVILRKNNLVKNSSNKSKSPVEKKEDGHILVPKTFTKEFGNKLANARTSKNMNRKDLSLKLNVKESVIADMENGKLLYDGNLVHKLKKIFPDL